MSFFVPSETFKGKHVKVERMSKSPMCQLFVIKPVKFVRNCVAILPAKGNQIITDGRSEIKRLGKK